MSNNNGRISMQDIADRLQISKNAVSLALRGKAGVSEETRQLVIALAKKLNYNNMGLVPDKPETENRNILVLIPEYIRDDSYFYNYIYWSIDDRASQRGYTAIMATVTDEMQTLQILPPFCSELLFAGFILIGVLQESYVRFLQSIQKTLLSVDHLYYGLNIRGVVTSNIEGSYYITQKVISYGHTKLGFVGPYKMTTSIFERWCGFQKAVLDANLDIIGDYVINADSPLDSLFSDSSEVLDRLSKLKSMPSAFVCAGDRIAIATISALRELGYHVPKQVSVVGFDDIEIGNYIKPKLTTMHVGRKEMGRLAVDLLLEARGKEPTADIHSIKPDYVPRESLAQARPF